MRLNRCQLWLLFTCAFISIVFQFNNALGDAIVISSNFQLNKAVGNTILVPSAGYPTIQSGIDAASDGDRVLVADGIYSGEGNYNITFRGKAITVQSENGPLNCIIDAQAQGRGIVFQDNEGPEAVLNGFTITNGKNGFRYFSEAGGGIYCKNSSPTISNCIIKNNYSTGDGGGLYFRYSQASIIDCIISDNYATHSGGGIYCDTSPINISNCRINQNNASSNGGGIGTRESSLTVQNCNINENASGNFGGGAYFSQSNANITNCIFANNNSDADGGGIYIYYCRPVITNSTIYGNSAADHGGGIVFKSCYWPPSLINSILWGDTPDEIFIEEYDPSNPTVKFCNIQGGYNGEGNFHGEPLFVNPQAGDFHLSLQSPCVGTGTSVGAPNRDIEGNPRPDVIGIDVGAYELAGYAGSRPRIDTFTIAPHPVDVPMEVTFSCEAVDPDGEITAYTIDYGDGSVPETNDTGKFTHTYESVDVYATCSASDNSGLTVNSESLSPLFNGTIQVPADYPDIQSAIDAAADKVDTTIFVADGIYTGEGNRNINFRGKAITVESQNGPAKAIIHCGRAGRGFDFRNKEKLDSVLSGFTIIYGVGDLDRGGGIYCGSSPTIKNCIIKNNEDGGIYIRYGSPLIKNCTITENRTGYYGGGIYILSGAPTISACTISKNLARGPGAGGGVGGGGGIYCHSSGAEPTLINSVISKNIALSSGGGIHGAASVAYTAINCTFSENISLGGGGGAIYHYSSNKSAPTPSFTNCIFWGNIPNQIYSGSPAYSNPTAVYSNIQGGYPGEGNISKAPIFVDPVGDNFRLHHSSPCIDTATSTGAPQTDKAGNPRPQISGHDMGAFEAAAYDPLQPAIESFSASVIGGSVPLAVTFTCLAQDSDGTTVTYAMDYGDGSEIDTNTTGNFSYVYESTGLAYARCSASDSAGKTAQSASIAIRRQGIIDVPSDFPTIQEAIDVALDGDTVRVADGIYTGHLNKNILFWGKAVTILSENGPEHTIIDCENDGRGFNFRNFENANAVVSGFKIINGRVDGFGGGGILCFQSSPTIDNCIIEGDTASSTVSGGGGICCDEYASPIITNSIIRRNTSARHGGGIFCHTYTSPVIIDSKVNENTAEWAGGGIYNYWYSYSSVINSEISNNRVVSGSGGGIYSWVSRLLVSNSVIANNIATYRGGGIYLGTAQIGSIDDKGNSAIISDCTIVANEAAEGAGGFYSLYSPAPTTNSIFWDNTPDQFNPGNGRLIPSLTYCNIKGGYPGEGNIDSDPLFLDPQKGDYHLTSGSPCIDTGTRDSAPILDIFALIYDLDDELRPVGSGYDIGADEYVDYDNDGLPNYLEPRYGADPNNADTDSDDLKDGAEVLLQTDPIDADTDDDGMPDGWEVAHGLDPTVDDSDQDLDGDEFSNLEEYYAGRHPSNSEPDKPELLLPADTDTEILLTPELKTQNFSDPDDDDHALTQWQISTVESFNHPLNMVYDATSDTALTVLVIPPSILDANNTEYFWRARFTDTGGAVSTWANPFSFSTSEDVAEDMSPEDGIPDNQMADCMGFLDADQVTQDTLCVHTESRNTQVAIERSSNVINIETFGSIDPAIISEDLADIELPVGLISFKANVNPIGGIAEIRFYSSEPIPNGATWFKYDPLNGWLDYSSHVVDISADRRWFTLEFQDGGFGDLDGVANGVIIDPSGPGVPAAVEGGSGDSGGGGGGGGG